MILRKVTLSGEETSVSDIVSNAIDYNIPDLFKIRRDHCYLC